MTTSLTCASSGLYASRHVVISRSSNRSRLLRSCNSFGCFAPTTCPRSFDPKRRLGLLSSQWSPEWLPSPAALAKRHFGNLRQPADHASSEGAPEGYKPRSKKFLFDKHRLVAYLRRRKRVLRQSEFSRQLDSVTPDPPEGWDVARFVRRVGFDQDHEESFLKAFTDWKSLMLWDPIMAEELTGTKPGERKRLRVKIQQFLHGLWPPEVFGIPEVSYRPPPLAEQDRPWNPSADKRLLDLAREFDVNFGYPWLYISWKMQRTEEDVHQRYIEIAKIPQTQSQEWDLLLHKTTQPLRMNRKFRIDPPFLYIVPSTLNYPPCSNAPTVPFSSPSGLAGFIPYAFQRYQRPECFTSSFPTVEMRTPKFEWQVGPYRMLDFTTTLSKGTSLERESHSSTSATQSRTPKSVKSSRKSSCPRLFNAPVTSNVASSRPSKGPLWRAVTVTHLPRLRRPYPFRKKIERK